MGFWGFGVLGFSSKRQERRGPCRHYRSLGCYQIRLVAGAGAKLFLHFHILDVQLQRIISREYCHFNGLNLNICLFICLIIATYCSPSIQEPKRIFQVVSCRNLSMVITSDPLSEGEISARTDLVKLNDLLAFPLPHPILCLDQNWEN